MRNRSNKPLKESFSVVIFNEDRSKIFIVKRAHIAHKRFGGMWSLPSGSLQEHESYEDGIHRIAQEKLGLKVKIKKYIGEGAADRGDYRTHLKEYECEILEGKPQLSKRYTEWKWGTADDLKEATKAGSLCSSIFLVNNKS